MFLVDWVLGEEKQRKSSGSDSCLQHLGELYLTEVQKFGERLGEEREGGRKTQFEACYCEKLLETQDEFREKTKVRGIT